MTTAPDAAPDYDLTCWYLNRRRVIELVGAATIAPRLQAVERMGGHPHLQDIAVEGVLKDAVTEWLSATRPPTLGELVVSDALGPGRIFTHYSNWFFKGLPQVARAQARGVTPLPPALAYAKLDTLRPGHKVECRFHAEHLVANSSWSELAGQRTKFVMGLITGVADGLIEAVPYVISDLAPAYDRPASLIGRAWPNKLEVFADQIDSFAAMAGTERPRRRSDLDALRDIPEADVKQAIADILGEPTVPADSDHFGHVFRSHFGHGFRSDLGQDAGPFVLLRVMVLFCAGQAAALRGRWRRRLSPLRLIVSALWTTRSRMASA